MGNTPTRLEEMIDGLTAKIEKSTATIRAKGESHQVSALFRKHLMRAAIFSIPLFALMAIPMIQYYVSDASRESLVEIRGRKDARPKAVPTIDPDRAYVDACVEYFKTQEGVFQKVKRGFVGLQTGDTESMKELHKIVESAYGWNLYAWQDQYLTAKVPPRFEAAHTAIDQAQKLRTAALQELLRFWDDADHRHFDKSSGLLVRSVEAIDQARIQVAKAGVLTKPAEPKPSK